MDKPILPVSARQYKGTCIFSGCEIDEIEKMTIRDDDTWVLSFPRSGTTLTQEIVFLLKTRLDFHQARAIPLDERFPFLDLYEPTATHFRGLKRIQEMTSPRLIKSHLHYHVLPPQLFDSPCKKIYVMRNPKDVVVSCMHLTKFLKSLDDDSTMETFLPGWANDSTKYGTPWWRHVRDFWNHRDDPSLLLLKYEEIVQDMPSSIRRIANHLDVSVTDDEVRQIADHCQFDNMKRNDSTNAKWIDNIMASDDKYGGHIRRGKVGGWRDYLTDTQSQLIDEMVLERLAHTGLTFDFGAF